VSVSVIVRFFKTEAGNEPAREYLRSLETADRQVCGAMLRAVQDFGLDAPGVEKRQLEGKLWELKPDQHRIMYVLVAGPTMVVLHGCKKERRKATKADLDVARKRMKQVLEEESQAKRGRKK
jgi:phage-related protein